MLLARLKGFQCCTKGTNLAFKGIYIPFERVQFPQGVAAGLELRYFRRMPKYQAVCLFVSDVLGFAHRIKLTALRFLIAGVL